MVFSPIYALPSFDLITSARGLVLETWTFEVSRVKKYMGRLCTNPLGDPPPPPPPNTQIG